MSDGSARHPRSFEPPPWEREQFEELARRRAEREAAEAAAAAREEAAARAATEVTATATQPAAAPAAARHSAVPDAVEQPAPAAAGEASAEVLLLELAAEEPKAFGYVWLVWLGAAGLFALLGVGTLVVGAVGLSRAHGSSVGTSWSFVLMLAGTASLGLAGWLTARALRERGA